MSGEEQVAVAFMVRGERVEMPERFTLGEQSDLITATGMTGTELQDAAADEDPRMLLGLLVIGYHRLHPRISLGKAIEHIRSLEDDEWEVIEAEADAVPPTKASRKTRVDTGTQSLQSVGG